MRLLSILLMALFMVACQPQEPNKIKIYQKAKATDTALLEDKFEQKITAQKEEAKQVLAANSLQAKNTLQAVLNKLEIETDATPSTVTTVLQNMDSTSATQALTTQPKNGAIQINVRDYQDIYNKIYKLKDKLHFEIIAEQETTTDYNRENTLQIVAEPAYFDEIMKECRTMATIIRKKYIWQQNEGTDYLKTKSQIETQRAALATLDKQLAAATNTEERLQVQEKITEITGNLDLEILTAQNLIAQAPKSSITLSLFQGIDIAKPAPEPFNASFSVNLELGWANFKVFLLQAALHWPYILIGFLFLLTALLAVASSKRSTRKFRLQALQAQQMNIQQQIAKNN